jgi:hypothetical protein
MSIPSDLARCATVGFADVRSAPGGTRQTVIYWWVVAVAGFAAALLVVVGVSLIYLLGRPPAEYRAEQKPPPQQPAVPVIPIAARPVAPTAAAAPEPPADELNEETPAVAQPQFVLTPEARVVRPTLLPQSELTLGTEVPDGETYGTRVLFLRNPEEAAQQALKARKLLFVLHLSGNFDDAQFT